MPKLDAPRAGQMDLCRRFLQSLGQSVKLVSLYKANHPVPLSSMQEAWHSLQEIFAETGWPQFAVSLVAGRWLANDAVVAESAQAYELLAIVFRSHAIQSLTFRPEARPFEFTTLCEMASTPPNRAYQTDASEFLKERGVTHIRANVEEFVRKRKVRPPATPIIENPLAQLRAPARPPAPAPEPPPAGRGFGAFIKSLIDEVVSEPGERAKLYGEAVRLVEQALARHVSEATHQLLLEKQGILNERMRAESVLASVAEGKVVVDKEGRVLMMDPMAEEIVGRQFVDLAGKPILENVSSGEQMVALAKDLVIPENGPVSDEVRVAGDDQVLNAFRQSLALVQDEHGRLVGTYAVLPYVAKYREAMKLQEDFVAKITHDLKAPLASICSTLELLSRKTKERLGPEEASFLEISLRNSRALSRMIGEILDFSKLQSGKMTVRAEPTRAADCVRESIESLTPWARSKGLALELRDADVLAGLPQVSADRGRVVQILNNLVSNAIKCTPSGGRIHVSAGLGDGETAGSVVVAVRDTGCGISPPDQKRIFEKFAQAAAGNLRREGVGLGLAIVKELVNLHGGRLWLESEVGKGSTFYFSLPLAARESALAGPLQG